MRQPIILSNSGENCGQEDQLALWSSATRAGHGNFDQYKFKFKFKCQCRPKVRQGNGQPESSDEVAPGNGQPAPIIEVERGTLHRLRAWYPAGVGPACSRLLCYRMPSLCVCCVCVSWVCCLTKSLLSFPASFERTASFRVADRGWSFFVCAV